MKKNEQAGRTDTGNLPGWGGIVAREQVLQEKSAKIITEIEVD